MKISKRFQKHDADEIVFFCVKKSVLSYWAGRIVGIAYRALAEFACETL